MAVDATLHDTRAALAALEAAPTSSLVAHGLTAAYPTLVVSTDKVYPFLLHYLLAQGSAYNALTIGGRGIGAQPVVQGQQQRLHQLAAMVAVGPRAVKPSEYAALDSLADLWADWLPDFYAAHRSVGSRVLTCESASGRLAVVTTSDGVAHYGWEVTLAIDSRPLLVYAQ